MGVTPETDLFDSDIEFQEEAFSNKTYRLDLNENKIAGVIDGVEAIKQAVNLILSTERYKYVMHSWDYGVELESLIGKDYDFILGDLKRRIEEALKQDDRVTGIENFEIKKINSNSILVAFKIETMLGAVHMEREVSV